MHTLDPDIIAEKNKIAGGSVWLVLLEIQIPGATLKLANNNEDIVWPTGGATWTAFPFELDQMKENSRNEIPALSIRVSNVSRDVLYYIEQAGGAVGFPVIIRVVNSDHLDIATAELEMDYVVKSVSYSAQEVTFTLGGNQHIVRRCPGDRFMKDFCSKRYGGVLCGVSAATMITYPTCQRTLAQCRERGNSDRFGGFPGIPAGGFYATV
jgi:phage-related protein